MSEFSDNDVSKTPALGKVFDQDDFGAAGYNRL